jgi:hypothetical protein
VALIGAFQRYGVWRALRRYAGLEACEVCEVWRVAR